MKIGRHSARARCRFAAAEVCSSKSARNPAGKTPRRRLRAPKEVRSVQLQTVLLVLCTMHYALCTMDYALWTVHCESCTADCVW